jgi:putative spermidine/putrescine transport system ATP-binding protein/putrescine transport system ATP-binding protein
MTGNSVEFHDVRRHFGPVTAIDGVSFDIAHGETVALLGPSGCGTTTILRVIAGFETPDSGSVRIAGTDMTRKRPYERNVGLLFQHYALFPHMTVAENVAYGLRHRGTPKADIPRRVTEMLELVKLPNHGPRMPGQLSGGQQQRVALARALATSPGVVLLDEPLSALDAKLRQELRAELKDVLAAVGSTAIVVTHDQEEAMSLGERVFIMNRGRIVQQGTPDDIYARPASRFVAEFMGRSNWFSGSMADGAHFATTCGLILQVTPPTSNSAAAHDVCVRPESIDLLPDTEPSGANRLPGRIVDVALLGAVRQVIVELAGGQQILALQPNRTANACGVGQTVVAAFPPAACVLVPAEPR